MPFKVSDFILILPNTIVSVVARCTRMQSRVNQLHNGLNAEVVKPPES